MKSLHTVRERQRTKTSFREASKLKNIWNRVVEWNGLKLATVLWQADKEWKLVDTMEFDLIKEYEDKSHIIFETHTQEELWQYIQQNNLHLIRED